EALPLELVDPAHCEQVPPPHLSCSIDDRLSQAFAALRQSRTTWKPVEVPLIAETEPACVRTVALLARAVETNADLVPTTAAKPFPTDANITRLDEIHADRAARAGNYDEALAGYERVRARDAAAGRRQSELNSVVHLVRTHLARSDTSDLTAVVQLAERNAASARELGRAMELATLSARARWRQGDVVGGDAEARAAG